MELDGEYYNGWDALQEMKDDEARQKLWTDLGRQIMVRADRLHNAGVQPEDIWGDWVDKEEVLDDDEKSRIYWLARNECEHLFSHVRQRVFTMRSQFRKYIGALQQVEDEKRRSEEARGETIQDDEYYNDWDALQKMEDDEARQQLWTDLGHHIMVRGDKLQKIGVQPEDIWGDWVDEEEALGDDEKLQIHSLVRNGSACLSSDVRQRVFTMRSWFREYIRTLQQVEDEKRKNEEAYLEEFGDDDEEF